MKRGVTNLSIHENEIESFFLQRFERLMTIDDSSDLELRPTRQLNTIVRETQDSPSSSAESS